MSENPSTLNIEDTHKLLNALLCKEGTTKQFAKGIRNYTMALTMLEAGLRVGELVRLRIPTLWFNSGPVTSIIIPAHISKSKKERSVPVSSRLANALTQMASDVWPSKIISSSWYAFYKKLCVVPLTTRQVERIINAAGMKSLGRPVNPHMLRHTFATKLMRVTDIRTVQEMLGHSSVISTQIYTHPDEQDKRDAVDKMNGEES